MDQLNQIKSKFKQELPDEFIGVVINQEIKDDKIETLSKVLNGFYKKHHDEESHSTSPYDNLHSLLENKSIAQYFIENPKKLISYVEKLRKITGFGAHNTFFTLGLEKVANMFVESPEIFLELAEKTGGESIGAFPSLKGKLMFQHFKKSPKQVISFYEKIVKSLAYKAGTVLNKLYEDELAKCFIKDSTHFIEILVKISIKFESNYSIEPFYAFRGNNFITTFSEYFDGKISDEVFFKEIEENSN